MAISKKVAQPISVSREGLLWSLGTGKRHAYASIVSVFT